MCRVWGCFLVNYFGVSRKIIHDEPTSMLRFESRRAVIVVGLGNPPEIPNAISQIRRPMVLSSTIIHAVGTWVGHIADRLDSWFPRESEEQQRATPPPVTYISVLGLANPWSPRC